MRAIWARSASALPCFVQICEILTFRQVVSLPIYAANIHIFHSCIEKMPLAPQKISTAFTATKVEDLTILKLVLFGTCLQKLCHVKRQILHTTLVIDIFIIINLPKIAKCFAYSVPVMWGPNLVLIRGNSAAALLLPLFYFSPPIKPILIFLFQL